MSISDGQAVNASNSNAAWASKTADNTFVGKQTLNRAGSGAQITDVQQEINDISSDATSLQTLSGRPSGSTDLGTFTGSTIPDGQNIKQALQSLETADELKIPLTQKGAANGVATLDGSSKIPTAQLPALAITDVYVVADITARNALTVEEGDVAIVLDAGGGEPNSYIYDGTTWQELKKPADTVTSVNGQTGTVVLDIDDLSDVTITSVQNRDYLKWNGSAWVNAKLFNLSTDSTTTGSNQTLGSVSSTLYRITNASLVSIDMIPAGFEAQYFILTNQTGASVTISNDLGGTAANRILTGTGSDLTLANEASIYLVYDTTAQRWLVVGGSGGGGSGSGGAIITDWATYTPTSSTWTSGATFTGKWRRVGGDMEVQISCEVTGALPSANFLARIPTPYTIDVTKLPVTPSDSNTNFGISTVFDSTGNTAFYGRVVYSDTQEVSVYAFLDATTYISVNPLTDVNPISFVAGDTINLVFKVPITGWLANGGTDSKVQVKGGNGYGSTDTGIRRFTTTVTNTGTDITYTDSATAGATFTINTDGVYSITFQDKDSVARYFGISVNGNGTIGIQNTTPFTERLAISSNPATAVETVTWEGKLVATDVIKAHTDGGATNTDDDTNFSIERIR